jgi:hypothetical protein
MATDNECVGYAQECVRLAGLAEGNPELRERLLNMAREWMAMAMHEQEMRDLKQDRLRRGLDANTRSAAIKMLSGCHRFGR